MFEKNTKKCFLAPFWPLFWPKLVKMTKKNFFLDSDAKPFPTRGHMPIFEQNYDNWYFRSQNGLSGPKKARKFWKTLKSSLGSWESLETIRICIIRQIRSAKVDIFTKTISPPPPPPPPPPDSYDSNTPPGHIWPRGKNEIFKIIKISHVKQSWGWNGLSEYINFGWSDLSDNAYSNCFQWFSTAKGWF